MECGAVEGWRRSVRRITWEMRSVTQNQGGEEYLTYNKKKES